MTGRSARLFPEYPSRENLQDWTNPLFEKMAQKLGTAKAGWPAPISWGAPQALTEWNSPHMCHSPSPKHPAGTTWVHCSWTIKTGTAKSWTTYSDCYKPGNVQRSGLWGQMILLYMSWSLNCLHLLCLKFSKNDLDSIFSTCKYWILKRHVY